MALAGFGLDSLIEIGASTVVIWELWGAGEERQRRGLRLIGYAFAALAAYLLVQSTVPAVNFQDVAVCLLPRSPRRRVCPVRGRRSRCGTGRRYGYAVPAGRAIPCVVLVAAARGCDNVREIAS